MGKGKSNYTFKFNANPVVVDSIVKAWLKANKFKLVNKYGEEFYYFNDPFLYGRRGFNYKIEGQSISISAWLISSFGKSFYMLDSGMVNKVGKDAYKDLLQILFNKISAEDKNAGREAVTHLDPVIETQDNHVKKYADTFEAENNARKEKLCVIGFVVSIIGCLLSLFGFAFGIVIYFFVFYFAAQGLKTSKRGLAIATIVISIMSIGITVFWLVMSRMLGVLA